MKNKKLSISFMAVGAGLLLCALGFLVYNITDEKRAAEKSNAMLGALYDMIPDERSSGADYDEILKGSEMKSVEIEGEHYIGVLEMPTLELSFPIVRDWSYAKLKNAPNRYKGSIFDNNLILIAHNYRRHFGRINLLAKGDSVVFIDVDGVVYEYVVAGTEILRGTAVEEMEAGEWDLTMFTCTMSGQSRITVRCNRNKSA
jgi:sortase A